MTVLVPENYVRPDLDDWLEARRKGLGGSDAGAILGVSKWKTPADVFDEKMGTAQGADMTRPMARGTVLEAVAADLWASNNQADVRRMPMRWANPSRVPQAVDPDGNTFLFCNVDRQVMAGWEGRDTGLLEVKVPGWKAFRDIQEGGLPESYICQVQHNLAVTGYDWAAVMIFHADRWDWVDFVMERDEDFIQALLARERAFWLDHVLAGVRPEDEVDEVSIPKVDGKVVHRDDDEFRRAAEDLREAEELKADVKTIHDQAKARMEALFTDEAALSGPAGDGMEAVVHRITSEGRKSFKPDRLADAEPLDPEKVTAFLKEEGLVTDAGFFEALRQATQMDLGEFWVQGKGYSYIRPYFRPEKKGGGA